MKTFLGASGALALALIGCGGNVVVDGATGTGGAVTMTTTTSTTPTTTFLTTTTVVTGPCSPTCSAAVTTGGPPPCGGVGLAAYDQLISCGCGSAGPCAMACGANFCLHTTLSTPCAQCLSADCGGNFQICTTN